ncbi:MAG: Dam family site-specific DNA-(adenine-N6)-methyltransferase, partial [Sphaerochaetaceae bacterium]|nr:Dam family site-specific DNA-(adenine-N6)-methyltransferase [Sphaerochaetaceae bacterium]
MNTFLKWPGGKRWFISKHHNYLPKKIEKNYIEPFLGGGSVFFYLLPENAILADINSDLINVYQIMRKHYLQLGKILQFHQEQHSPDYYYLTRTNIPEGEIEQAARFLYLNRTCFNGMYRENKNGVFNVPIGVKAATEHGWLALSPSSEVFLRVTRVGNSWTY